MTERQAAGLDLRPAGPHDALDVLAWRNDLRTRAVSIGSQEIGEAEHLAWFDRTLRDPDALMLIGEQDGAKVGVVRLNRHAADAGLWTVSINVNPARRGRGFGTALIEGAVAALRRRHAGAAVLAVVNEDNAPSRAMFERCGFVARDTQDGWINYHLAP